MRPTEMFIAFPSRMTPGCNNIEAADKLSLANIINVRYAGAFELIRNLFSGFRRTSINFNVNLTFDDNRGAVSGTQFITTIEEFFLKNRKKVATKRFIYCCQWHYLKVSLTLIR